MAKGISLANTGKVWINNDQQTKFVTPIIAKGFIEQGWKYGRPFRPHKKLHSNKGIPNKPRN